MRSARRQGLVGWLAWHGAGNSSDEKDQDGVGTPASDPVLVWRPTLWSVEYLTPVLRQSRPHAGHSQPLIGSGRLGLAVRCRDNDVARSLAEACQTSPANQAAVHSTASPSCFTLCTLCAFLQPTVAVRLVSIHMCCNKQYAACSRYIIWRGDQIALDSERALRSSSR